MRYLLTLLLGYLLAAPLSARVPLDITQTDWTHIATYFWILFGWLFWALIALFLTLVFAVLLDR